MHRAADSPDPELLELASDAPGAWQEAAARVRARGLDALPLLERGLKDDRLGSTAHWRILLVLRELALKESLAVVRTALQRALVRGDWAVTTGAMETLAALRTPEAVDELLPLLAHPDLDVAKYAAVLAGKTGDRRAGEPLLHLLQSPSASLRYAAASGLAELADPTLRAALERHLAGEQDPEVRERLLHALRDES